MGRFILTLDKIDILYFVYSNFCTKILSIKYQSHPNLRKIETFEQEKSFYHNPIKSMYSTKD